MYLWLELWLFWFVYCNKEHFSIFEGPFDQLPIGDDCARVHSDELFTTKWAVASTVLEEISHEAFLVEIVRWVALQLHHLIVLLKFLYADEAFWPRLVMILIIIFNESYLLTFLCVQLSPLNNLSDLRFLPK